VTILSEKYNLNRLLLLILNQQTIFYRLDVNCELVFDVEVTYSG